jgi:serine/threonine-protein kinase
VLTWDLASRATKLEGEVASHTRRLEALEKRGRALRAEIGRKVEELAQQESRALREVSHEQAEVTRLREEIVTANKAAQTAHAEADATHKQGAQSPAQLREVFERSGFARATLESKREQMADREKRAAAREGQATDLRKQIEELRSQLSRYAEALEEDLAQGREKVALRTREGLKYEKSFGEVSLLLLNHLKGKSEARDLMQDLLANMHGSQHAPPAPPSVRKPGPSIARFHAPSPSGEREPDSHVFMPREDNEHNG